MNVHRTPDLTPTGPWPTGLPQPLQQSLLYGLAMRRLGAEVERLSVSDCDDNLVCDGLVLTRRLKLGARLSTLFRGPLWHTDDTDARIAALKAVRRTYPKHRWKALIISPDAPAGSLDADCFRRARWRPVLTGISTIRVSLDRSDADLRSGLHGKWRNQLTRAEKAGLTLHTGEAEKHWSWLLDKEDEQREIRRYQGLPAQLVTAYHHSGKPETPGVLGMTAHLKGQKIAGALFLLHGQSATYHIGYAGPAAREVSAHNLVLFQSLVALRARGIRFLDLGGVNTETLPGLARFKLGLGSEPVTLAGSFA